jgi:hypothetical protein
MKTLANKRFWLGMLVIGLVLGMTVVGCGGGDDDPVFYVNLDVGFATWSNLDGEVYLSFWGSEPLTLSDLSWVTIDKFSLEFFGAGARTASIVSVTLEVYNEYCVRAKLVLRRTAVRPPDDFLSAAVVHLTIPSAFASQYSVSWAGVGRDSFSF